MGETTERRRYPRRPVKQLLRYRCVQTGGIVLDRNDQVGQLVDMSQTGASLKVKRDFPIGAILEVELSEKKKVHAKVVSVRGLRDEPGLYRASVAFVRAPSEKAGDAKAACATTSDLADPGSEGRGWSQRIRVEYRCVTEGVHKDLEPRAGHLLDIKPNGVVITALKDYPAGAILDISLPDSEACKARRIHGRVVWSKGQDRPGHWRFGCVFVRVPSG